MKYNYYRNIISPFATKEKEDTMTNDEYRKQILAELEKIENPEALELILELAKRLQD